MGERTERPQYAFRPQVFGTFRNTTEHVTAVPERHVVFRCSRAVFFTLSARSAKACDLCRNATYRRRLRGRPRAPAQSARHGGDRRRRGGRAELLGSELQVLNGSLLMLKIKYLSGSRSGEEMIRNSKYNHVHVE